MDLIKFPVSRKFSYTEVLINVTVHCYKLCNSRPCQVMNSSLSSRCDATTGNVRLARSKHESCNG